MGNGGAWERDEDLEPTALVIYGGQEPCEKCRRFAGVYRVTPTDTLAEILESVELPPYHRNCVCHYQIYYRNAASYMNAKQLLEVLKTFRSIRDHYAAKMSPGRVDNMIILLPFIKDHEKYTEREILAELEDAALKSCGSRAGELITLFEGYLRTRSFGTSGCKFEIVTNLAGKSAAEQARTAHGWVRFQYEYLDANGNHETGYEDFDAWRYSLDEWLHWLSSMGIAFGERFRWIRNR